MSFERDIKFRIKGSTLYLTGVISETSSFASILPKLKECTHINFSEVEQVSWIGLVRLDETVVSMNKRFTLVCLTPAIHRMLRLLPGVQFRYDFESFMLEIYNTQTLEQEPKPKEYSLGELRELCDNFSRGNLIHIEENLVLDGIRSELLPEEFLKPKPESFKSLWCHAHKDESLFWSRFMHFWVSASELSVDMMNSRINDLDFIIIQMEKLLSPLQNIFEFSNPGEKNFQRDLDVIKEWLDEEGLTLKTKIEAILEECRKDNRRIKGFGDQESFFDGRRILGSIRSACESMLSSMNFLGDIETLGQEFAESLFDLNIPERLKWLIKEYDVTKLNTKQIAILQSTLDLPKKPKNKSEFAEIYTKYLQDALNELEEEINSCIVLFQGLDLLRQVLEHRRKEAEEILLILDMDSKEKDQNWQQIEDDFIVKIKKLLVTDQEKYAFSFYFTHIDLEANDDSRAPGEMLLF